MPVPATIVEIAAQTGVGMVLHRDDILKIVDLHGKQVADLALFRQTDLTDSFSAGRTIDYNESIRISTGSVLYSGAGAPLARVVEDTSGVHDMLLSPCSEEMFARRGEFGHPSCLQNLSAALGSLGVREHTIAATLNVFMDVRIDADGGVKVYPPASAAGDSFAIVALQDLVIGLAACSSERTNDGACKPIGYALTGCALR